MNKICTSIEQSKKLIELGIDVNTADMYWWSAGTRYYIEAMDDGDFNEEEGHIRAWSLTALFVLMPKIGVTTPIIANAMLMDKYYCTYYGIGNYKEVKTTEFYKNPIDAAFEMICWLLENNKL